jgi:TatD DNase family protein
MIKTDNFKYIDTHCHLDLYKDYKTVISEAKNNSFVVAVTNMPSAFLHEEKLFISDNVAVSLGLHPQLIREYGHELSLFIELLPKTRFIGEVGLDYQEFDTDIRKKQRMIFEKILFESAKFKDKILTVHSRKSAEDVVSIIGSNFPGSVILHWYSGSKPTLKKALSNNLYFSINTSMITSKNGQDIIQEIPLERILTETDGPFVKANNKIVIPSDIEIVIDYLAELHGKTKDDIKVLIKNNFLKILDR